MRCYKCNKESPDNSSFCIHCGSTIGIETLRLEMLSLKAKVRGLTQQMKNVDSRMTAMEQSHDWETVSEEAQAKSDPIFSSDDTTSASSAPAIPSVIEIPSVTQMPVPAELQPDPVQPKVDIEQAPVNIVNELSVVQEETDQYVQVTAQAVNAVSEEYSVSVTAKSQPELRVNRKQPLYQPEKPIKPSKPQKEPIDWEQWLPGNWLARIGIVALFIAMGFFLKLAFDRDWISDLQVVILGVVFGLGLIGAGEFWRKRYRVWAQALTGGGIAITYLSIFASYAVYDLMPFMPAYIVMAIVTVIAAIISIRQDSLAIAILGIMGAFFTPVILGAVSVSASTDSINKDTNINLLLPYIFLLDIGVLILGTFRNWRWLSLLGLLGSLMLFGLWYRESDPDPRLLLSLGSLTIIFLIFTGATTLYHLLWRRPANTTDLALMTLNAVSYFGISYAVLWNDYRDWIGLFSYAIAVFYGLLSYTARKRNKENMQLSLFAMSISVVFLTIAIPMQLGGPWMTVAWAAEAAVLLWLWSRLEIKQLRYFSIGVFAISLIRLFSFEVHVNVEDYRPIFNDSMLAFISSIAAFYCGTYLLRKKRNLIPVEESWFIPAFMLIANLLTLWMASSEITRFIDDRNAMFFSLSVLWGLYALALFLVGLYKKSNGMRLGGYALFCITIGAVLIFLNHSVAHAEHPVANYSFMAFSIVIALLYFMAHIASRYQTALNEQELQLLPIIISIASILTLWAISSELITFIEKENIRNISLCSFWQLYALGLIMVGNLKQWRWMRFEGLAFICCAVIATVIQLNHSQTVVNPDNFHPIINYSFLAFAISIASLYFTSYLLKRGQAETSSESTWLFPIFLSTASFLTVWVISAEFINSFESENTKNLCMYTSWTLYALGLISVGTVKRWRWMRLEGLVFLCLAVIMIVAQLNYSKAIVDLDEFTPLINNSFLATTIGIGALYLAAYLLKRGESKFDTGEMWLFPIFVLAANLMTIWVFSEEIIYALKDYDNARNMALTFLWAAYAFILIIVGIMKQWRWVRLGGLALLSIAICKVFLFDMFYLGGVYRISAFASLGVILIVSGFAYQRFSVAIKRFILE